MYDTFQMYDSLTSTTGMFVLSVVSPSRALIEQLIITTAVCPSYDTLESTTEYVSSALPGSESVWEKTSLSGFCEPSGLL